MASNPLQLKCLESSWNISYKHTIFFYVYIYINIRHICEIYLQVPILGIYIYIYILSYLNIRNAPSNKSSFVAFFFATRQRSSARRSFQLFGLKAWVQNAAEGTSTRKPWVLIPKTIGFYHGFYHIFDRRFM